jgi:hypothetical protein
MADTLQLIGNILHQILNINMPWYDLRFGDVLIGPLFIGLLIGVFVNIFTSLNDDSSSNSKKHNGPKYRRNKDG